MIHNGIIENYADIKKNLMAKGVEFKSETDTEVLVQLIEYIQVKKDLDLLTAVQVALRQVIGAYAIAILDKRNPDQIIAARKQSPLVVGIGEGEFFLGSDASPIIEFTDKVVYLEDGNIAVMKAGEELQIVNIYNEKLLPEVKRTACAGASTWTTTTWPSRPSSTTARSCSRPSASSSWPVARAGTPALSASSSSSRSVVCPSMWSTPRSFATATPW